MDHREKVQKAVDMQQIVFRGELLPERTPDETNDEATSAVSQTNDLDEIFFVFNARDEREPHQFIMGDPLYSQGIVKEWHI